VDQVLRNPPPPLNHVWAAFSPEEKFATAALAYVIKDGEQYAGIDTVHERIPSELRGQIPDTAGFINACDHLCREEWLERGSSTQYRFRVDLLRMWIAREHSIWQVADDPRRGMVS
jgi:hypothetical protein